MATKECPSCGAEVPAVAQRCKHCFHDFTETPKKKNKGLVVLLGFIAAMAIIGAGTMSWVFYFSGSEKVVVDAETQSVVITHKTATATSTDRIPFSDIAKVEHVMGGDHAMFEVVLVTKNGDRYTIKQSSDKPLVAHAEHVAAVIGADFEQVRNIRTFGD